MSLWLYSFARIKYERLLISLSATWRFCLGWVEGWHPEVRKQLIEFFTEAAVLVAVFPMLDTIIGGRNRVQQSGQIATSVTWGLASKSLGLALFLLIVACIMSLGVRRD